jgi:1-acyl-sn-glycerol-3-phosphate acyltransferase
VTALERASHAVRQAWNLRGFARLTAGYCSLSVVVRPITGEQGPHRLMRRYFDAVIRELGIALVAEGTEKVAPTGPCIIAVNHNSLLDVPVVGTILPIDYKWVSKKSIFYVPFVGWHLWAAGHIWVDRNRKDNMDRLSDEFHRVVGTGGSILMFPEGTRSPDGRLQKFKAGAFVTAVRENVPVLPIVLDGTERLLTKGELLMSHGVEKVVRLRVCDPIAPPPATESDERRVIRLRNATRRAMVEALDALRGAAGAAERPSVA